MARRDDDAPKTALTRRQFLLGSAGAALLSALPGCDETAGGSSVAPDALDATDLHDTTDTLPGVDIPLPDTHDAHDTHDASELDTVDTALDTAELVDTAPDLPDTVEPPPLVDPTPFAEDLAAWPQRVQAGSVTAASASLWTRSTEDLPQRLRVWRLDGDATSADPAQPGPLAFEADLAPDPASGILKHTADGLEPGAWYGYAFFDETLARRSPLGRFRAAPAPGSPPEPLTLACATCSNLSNSPYQALVRSAALPADLVAHLGDMSYNDGAISLDDYRARWRDTLDDPGYQALLPRAAMVITWDDHEVDNNYDPETLDPAQLAAAKTAFFEHVAQNPGAPDGRLWTSFRWGDTAELFVLDSRSERRPSTRRSATPVYLGTDQMTWLRMALLESPCHFKILLNSVPMTNMPLVYDVERDDRWEGYQAQRSELLAHITAMNITNVWFLSGDFHIGFVARVEPEGAARRIYEIAVGPTANGPNPAAWLPHPEDQFDYVGTSTHAMTTLTFDPLADQVHVRFVEADDGNTLYEASLQSRP